MKLGWILAIGLGGALGSITRFGISSLLNNNFPWGTLTVNVLGSLILGALFAYSETEQLPINSIAFAFLAIGFCGAFTTFSTFSLELFKILGSGNYVTALGYLFGNLVLSFSAVCAGYFSVSALSK